MTELLTAAQMRAIEQAAIESGEVTGLELMERAGQGVVEAIFEEWPELAKTSHRAVVLCGPGNNGGDGFVVARLLKEWGWEVEVFLYGNAEELPADAKVNYERWCENANVIDLTDDSFDGYIDDTSNLALVVDALFGIGLSRPFYGLGRVQDEVNYAQSIPNRADQTTPKVVAIDVPSGLNSDDGNYTGYEDENPLDSNVVADITVTFQAAKLGHFLQYGPISCRKLVIKDIGLSFFLDQISAPQAPNPCVKEPAIHVTCLTMPPPNYTVSKSFGHKFSHGHAVICSGPATKTGAARLAARGALRIGAGLVTVASPASAQHENAAHLTAIMLRVADTAEDFKTLLSDDRISSICIGPGFACVSESGGLDFDHTRQVVKAVLSTSKFTVLDADALTAFKDTPDDLLKHLHPNCVLTPHEGEFKRLFPDIHAKLSAPTTKGPAYSKVDATRDAAAHAGCTILFKGPDTVIANEQGRASINSAHYDRAAPWLATAGSGDVLAGFITGLLARGFDPMQAAETAAYLHVECALEFGPGLIAEDIPEQLPTVFSKLGL